MAPGCSIMSSARDRSAHEVIALQMTLPAALLNAAALG
jgi:hypothetical protein